ncbi:hypothetical protein KLP40_05240 [Hymenobacter sp. NST-14]|uniref:hypothetical protein n=1 Tax=Hymenobacter piscis TaxID=2839984 RepID=UPI001C01F8B5|nr:hypothetical protein [Hymenobacter piscis]MBT9392562.1 hypothetical protein [Hymenobacter piscis]
MRDLGRKVSRYPNEAGFVAALVLFEAYLMLFRHHELYYDAKQYWGLARNLEAGGNFSLYQLTTQLRGYLLPLLNVPLVFLERTLLTNHGMALIKSEGALVAAALFGVAGPRFWQVATGRVVPLGRRLAFIGLGFLFWRDHFGFILSDFPALLFLLSGTELLLGGRHLGRLLLGGIVLAGTIYIRPIYLLSLPLVLLFRLLKPDPAPAGRQLAGWVALVAGALLVAAPQLAINRHNFASASPLVIYAGGKGQYTVAGTNNLYLWHLIEGLRIQKYETSVGTDYPKPQVYYLDAAARQALAGQLAPAIRSYADYFGLIARQPLDMVALFGRHLFNGLDVLYSSPYVEQVAAPNNGLALLHYAVFFGALVVGLRQAPRLAPRDWLLVAALVVPVLAAVPLVVECRFFISLHLLAYGLVCFGLPHPARWQSLWAETRQLPLLAAFGLFLLGCVLISANTRASLELPITTTSAGRSAGQ